MRAGAAPRLRRARIAVLMLLVMLGSSATAMVQAEDVQTPITTVEGVPPVMCGAELCPTPDRFPDRAGRGAAEAYGWWTGYGPDLDANGMDDRLQRVLDGGTSVSPTAVLGADGRRTVAIVIDFAWHPTSKDVDAVRSVLARHGWDSEEGGAWFDLPESLDAIVLDRVPVAALVPLWQTEGVVVVEMQNVLAATNEVAAKAVRARDSDVYAGEVHPSGYTGDGVVIAVLDTGVDNEHRALNDFDDDDDEPDLDPLSYDDHKWVAGFDATSASSNPDGSQDPDDGSGHGTHVAASALGTGDSSRRHMGTAPGAYLVDVKVLTDAGGTNSQYSISGIQWVVNNVDTDWGHNGSSRGIQIASMSFGSVGTPLNPDDTGDNGSSAEARLVNQAVEAGVVCVIAMGNDGTNRVPSPASADLGIAVAASNDRNSVNRTDDGIASYSNSGPRDDDGDDDEMDELKPDIASPGTGITSATAATGATFPGQPTRPMADRDYDSKDGTSMATPLASGVVALMLEADPDLEPEDVKEILRRSAEVRGSPYDTDLDPVWNEEWGWGLIDASCAVDTVRERTCTSLQGGTVVAPPPVGDGEGHHVHIESLSNGTLHLAGERVRFAGTVEEAAGRTYTDIEVRLEQYRDGSSIPVTLVDWRSAGGDVDAWFLDLTLQEEWADETADYTLVLARARTEQGDLSAADVRWFDLGKMEATITGPSANFVLEGSVTFTGSAQGPDPHSIEAKVDNGPWTLAANLDDEDFVEQSWSWSWDSTTVDDGDHRISFRFVNTSGATSEAVRRTWEVDNLPAAPELGLTGIATVLERDLPVTTAVAGTILEVQFELVNDGDAVATDVAIALEAPGTPSEVYPDAALLSSVDAGERRTVSLWWWATEPGTHQVMLSVDPNDRIDDVDRSDNDVSFSFTVEPRPVEATLRLLHGAVTTVPRIPVPWDPFEVSVRIDNLGQTDAGSLRVDLERWTLDGWLSVDSLTLPRVQGGLTSTGYAMGRFTDIVEDVGAHQYRVMLVGDGVESEHAEHRFTIVADLFTFTPRTGVSLDVGETPLRVVGGEDGSVLFTVRDGELHARTLSSKLLPKNDVLIERAWGGELAATVRSDGMVQMAWTRRTMSEDGYTLHDLGIAALTLSGQMTPVQRELNPLKLSEGSYWGLDIAERDGEVVIAGYHRDISTGGSWLDLTSVFTMVSDSPDRSGSWDGPTVVATDVDVLPSAGAPVSVAIGEERLHVLYQSERSDRTGLERLGLLYTHGARGEAAWSFVASAGDNVSAHDLQIMGDGDDERLVAAWIDEGSTTMLCSAVTTDAWSIAAPHCVDAPGAHMLSLVPREHGVMVLYDEVTVRGPLVRFGLLGSGTGAEQYGLSDVLTNGRLLSASGPSGDVLIGLTTTTGLLDLHELASLETNSGGTSTDGWLASLLAPLPGDEDMQIVILAGVGLLLAGLAVAIVVTATLGARSRKEDDEPSSHADDDLMLMVTPEADVEPELVLDPEPEVVLDEPEAIVLDEDDEPQRPEPVNERQERRRRRAMGTVEASPNPTARAGTAAVALPPLPAPPQQPGLPPLPSLPPLPAPAKQAVCPSCAASFTVRDLMLRHLPCPLCGERVEV